MNIKRMTALLKRELLDIFRDKKTLIMMVVVPLLLYPLLIVGMSLIMSAVMKSQEEKTYTVAFYEQAEVENQMEKIFTEREKEIGYHLEIKQSASCEQALEDGTIDAYITAERKDTYKINYLSAKDRSQTAANALKDAFVIYRDELRKEMISDAGLDIEAVLNPITYELTDQSSTEESIGNIIGSVMPFFVITSILLGALYPAIDVTAGEKERGTLETLLTLPVTNFEMIMSKFLAVSVIASVSAFLNIFSMGIAMIFFVSSSITAVADMQITIRYESFIPGILFTLIVMVFFALLVTAVSMCVCVFAKSFKEANNYATPVMLVFMFSSYISMLPDIELSLQNAAIPIVNVALLIEGLFRFQYDYGLFAIVLFSNVAYSLLAVMVLGRIYNSEQVLFSEGFSSVHIFKKRSEMKEKQLPGIGDIILLMCAVLLGIFYIGTFAQIKLGFGGVAVSQAIILLCPLFYAWYLKTDMKKLFSVKVPELKHIIGGLCLAVAAIMTSLIIGMLLSEIFSESSNNLMDMEKWFEAQPFIVLALVVALMPAIGEELLFRGFLMGSLKAKYKPWITIAVTAFLFAAYHMSLIKLFTVGVIGLALTYAAYQSGSIFVSVLMHFCNNFFSILIAKFPDRIQGFFPILAKERLSVPDMLLLSVVVIICFLTGLYLLKKQSDSGRQGVSI